MDKNLSLGGDAKRDAGNGASPVTSSRLIYIVSVSKNEVYAITCPHSSSTRLQLYLIFLKVDVAQVQYGGKNSKDGRLVVGCEVKDLHGSKQTQEVFGIVFSRYSTIPSLCRDRMD